MIIEVKSPEILYFILKRFSKVVIYYYAPWRAECARFNDTYQEACRGTGPGITFCQVNVDLLPYIQELYDVNIYRTPAVIFMRDGQIVEKLYGDKPSVFIDVLHDFGR